MTARRIFDGKNIVVTLTLLLVYLTYSSFQSPDSSLSQLLSPKPTSMQVITQPLEEDSIEEHEPDPDQTNQSVQGIQAQRQIAHVTKVVDGDTIEVSINGTKEKIRIIGLNTPETVDPRRGVQCFGREASQFAKQTLNGKTVYLESDPTQSERDKYARLLRFVFLEDGTDFGEQMIQQGYGYEYTYGVPYAYQTNYKQTQKQAQANKKGLWAENACK